MTSTGRALVHGSGQDAQLLAAQLDLLAGVVSGHRLSQALDSLVKVVEKISADGMIGSVLLLDETGRRLLHGAAPSLPTAYNEAIHGIEIGPSVGSCGTAAATRRQVIVEDIQTDPKWADFRELAASAGLRACWSTPIIGDGDRLLGTFAMYYPQPARPSPADLALIDVLVRTVGLAIARSRQDERQERALAEERAVGLTFQKGLLPHIPDRIGPVDLATRYRNGDPGVHVGGDWFDAIETDDGLVLVVGDVQGHDAQAAALMGQLRTVVRVTASEGHPPSGVLARTADYLERLGSDLLATVLVVHLDVTSRLATVACAGHLPPLVLSQGYGRPVVTVLDVDTAPPLGVGDRWDERSTLLPPESLLLLYTDGLVETRSWDIDEGVARLQELLRGLPSGTSPADVLDAALELLPAGRRGDDVAVVAARLPRVAPAQSDRIERTLPPQPMSVPLARSWAQTWLTERGTSTDVQDTVLLVLSELFTNGVRQSDVPVRLALTDEGGTLRVEVFDSNPRLPRLSQPDDSSAGGRGLFLVEMLSAAWGVEELTEGKTVWALIDA
jgi:anti-sigma regulatory factor (Ser/Thr protein kinase)